MTLLQNKVDQVLQSPQRLNDSSLPGETNPHCSTTLEASSSPLIDSATQQTVAETNVEPMPACAEAHCSISGSDTASGFASSSTRPFTTKVMNTFRRGVARIMPGIVASGSATPLSQ